ncbi:MAG TPA: hypothetical protein VK616_15655 [Flavitalea sp.]|nr:hypothetical protein [Flavitalea sp.]
MTKKQALEDFRWLRFSLDYVHPRLYKYGNKTTVDARFDSIGRSIHSNISGLDFPTGRGVMPTHQINHTIADVLNNKDLELDLAKKLIRDKNSQ